MNVEYILLAAVFIVVISFTSLFYILMLDVKKKMVTKKIDKFSIRSGKKVTDKELDKIMKYIEKNKKYLTPSAYKIGMYKIDKAKMRMAG